MEGFFRDIINNSSLNRDNKNYLLDNALNMSNEIEKLNSSLKRNLATSSVTEVNSIRENYTISLDTIFKKYSKNDDKIIKVLDSLRDIVDILKQENIIKSQALPTTEYLKYLSPEELERIKELNILSNKLQKENNERKDLLGMSLTDLFNKWSGAILSILQELVFMFNSDKYSGYFKKIENTQLVGNGIIQIIRDIISTFMKEDRMIYVGFTFIIISIFIYFIKISE